MCSSSVLTFFQQWLSLWIHIVTSLLHCLIKNDIQLIYSDGPNYNCQNLSPFMQCGHRNPKITICLAEQKCLSDLNNKCSSMNKSFKILTMIFPNMCYDITGLLDKFFYFLVLMGTILMSPVKKKTCSPFVPVMRPYKCLSDNPPT